MKVAFATKADSSRPPIRITKNLRVCSDCQRYIELAAKVLKRNVMLRDSIHWHSFSASDAAC
jgi:hypothetical protein